MNDLREAAEMALEALDAYSWEQVDAARTALRQALAQPEFVCAHGVVKTKCDFCKQPEQEPLGAEWVPCVKLPIVVHVRNQREGETHISTREGITPVLPDDLIMRGVAGEQYPIGRELFERTYTFDVDAVNMSQERVDETPKREHEPVAWMCSDFNLIHRGYSRFSPTRQGEWNIPVYTAPPKREWVGLKGDEISECWATGNVVTAVEAKLKEKNT